MRKVKFQDVVNAVREMCIEANCKIGEDVLKALREAVEKEESEVGREVLNQIIENDEIAMEEKIPICQDTGQTVVFADVGEDVKIEGGTLKEAITEGVRKGYVEGYLRKSMVEDPLRRKNTGDNTPPIIHIDLVKGEKLRIIVAPKGGGSENMSAIRMLSPAEGKEGVKKFVIETVRKAGGNPCPPVIVGVGIGGDFELCAILAKKALLRDIGERNEDPFYAQMEIDLLEEINKLGIGPMGLGGRITALDVHIEAHPCHITAIPVAVNIQCHAARHKERIL